MAWTMELVELTIVQTFEPPKFSLTALLYEWLKYCRDVTFLSVPSLFPWSSLDLVNMGEYKSTREGGR